jgi:hypothetical protein
LALTVQLGAVTVECSACGARYDLNGKARVVEPGADAMLGEITVPVDGPCPGCAGPDDSGETVAAE